MFPVRIHFLIAGFFTNNLGFEDNGRTYAGFLSRLQWPSLDLKLTTQYAFFSQSFDYGPRLGFCLGVNAVWQYESFNNYSYYQLNINYAQRVNLNGGWFFRSIRELHPAFLLGDFKRFTSKAVVKAIQENPRESRKEFLLEQFKKAAGKSSNVNEYQFWRHDNKPIELWSNKVIWEKISYVHNNPVEAGLVYKAPDYVYSSALDYADEKGLLDDVVVFRYYG